MLKKILFIGSMLFALLGLLSCGNSGSSSNVTQHEPKFLSKSEINVEEGQIHAITLEVENSDKERITYGIAHDDWMSFNVDSLTGEVTFKTLPNHAEKKVYKFTATAKYTAMEPITQDITININKKGTAPTPTATPQPVETPTPTATPIPTDISESDYFITTWKTDNNGSSEENQILISTNQYKNYNYTIYWGDGKSDSSVTKDITHTYENIGVYTIKISGDFPEMESHGYDWGTKTFKGDAEKLLSIDQWGTIKWETMSGAFYGCTNMVGKFIDTPNLSQVTNMTLMFARTDLFNSDIGNWDVSNVTNMGAMFNVAKSFNQDISNWDVSNVTNMSSMFGIAQSFNQDISKWNVSNVVETDYMFGAAYQFNQDISSWNVSNVKDMHGMFISAKNFNQDISGWDVSKVENMKKMFLGAKFFNQDISSWDISSIKTITTEYEYSTSKGMDDMFKNSALSTSNYNKILDGWSSQTVNDGLELGVGSIKYGSSGENGRNRLINDFGWTINDGGKE